MRYEIIKRFFDNTLEREGENYLLPKLYCLNIVEQGGYHNSVNGGGYGGSVSDYTIELEGDCFYVIPTAPDNNDNTYYYIYDIENISSMYVRVRPERQQNNNRREVNYGGVFGTGEDQLVEAG